MKGRRRGAAGLAFVALVMVAVLTSLGVWQLQRRAEKHRLIAALTERLAATPVPLPPPLQWSSLTPDRDEFRRVTLTAAYARPDAMVYSAGSAVRGDISGPGAWAFVPARLASGETVVVNTGFVQNTMQDRAQQDRAIAPLVAGGPATLTGYLRFPEAPGSLMPSPTVDKRLWFARDVPGMAKMLAWGAVTPFYIDLEAPMPASGIPKPGPLDVHLKDDHLQYAITWFGLALAVGGAFSAWLMQRRRE